MFSPKLKLPQNIYDRVKAAALTLNVTPDEFASKVLEAEASKVLMQGGKKEVSAAEAERIANQLKGLGYIE